MDFDGTIADHDGHIPASGIEAIRTARRLGHRVFLSTGRSQAEISPEVTGIGFDGAITAGGGFATVAGRLVHAQVMPASMCEQMVEAFVDLGLPYCLQYRDRVYAAPGLLEAFAGAGRGGPAGLLPHRLTERLEMHGVAKAVFVGTHPGASSAVACRLAENFGVITGTLPDLGAGSGEVSSRWTHKAAAIPAVLAAVGIPLSQTIALGDSRNDVEMLRLCGTGIAMGGAPALVMQAADDVTGTVGEDGLRTAFERHGLLQP
ncbi:HAD hydrolase family protein [Kineococcus gynurae]|uniref:HAD hydrolase family protein n=1 Tax=Kineococcus gynurae TaxID=452979 RepID=A0ABV5LW66_9ACTN